MLRSHLFNAAFYVATAVILVVGSPLLLGPRAAAMWGLRMHAYACLWLLRVIVGTRLEVRHAERLPKGAALVASKHQSAWETFALIPLLHDPAMVMKAELKRIPLYGWFSQKFGMIFVAREQRASALKQMLKDAKDRAAEGRHVLIFPEGTRQSPGAPPAYKPGALALYEALGVVCVPVALNSGMFWPRNSPERRPGTIVVEFLEPIPPGLPRKEFQRMLQERIEIATDRLVTEARSAATRSRAVDWVSGTGGA